MKEEIPRKLFHALGLIYVAGIVWLSRPVFTVLLIAALAAIGLWEWARLRHDPLNRWFNDRFKTLVREKERRAPSGLFWMLLGVLSVSVLAPSNTIAVSALLYLIAGDGLASLGGKFFRGPHWPGSQKRLSGSAVCFIACFIVSLVLVKPVCGWTGVWAGSLTATAVEAGIIPIDDNFLIPFLSALALLAACGQAPLFW